MAQLLDVKGLNCPLPVLRTKKAMKAVPKGEVLTVEATDPNTLRDIAALCEASGFALLSSEEQGGVFVFRIQQTA
ncbi:MAG TPA: sulfurtransferase TusA family protein [Ferrovibrio sp.]|uniref:sulfurtransferase TusA family protein n=1 Tax=Ferrovibrio sp. TaxID=1917215 RepID=UPI002ED44D54